MNLKTLGRTVKDRFSDIRTNFIPKPTPRNIANLIGAGLTVVSPAVAAADVFFDKQSGYVLQITQEAPYDILWHFMQYVGVPQDKIGGAVNELVDAQKNYSTDAVFLSRIGKDTVYFNGKKFVRKENVDRIKGDDVLPGDNFGFKLEDLARFGADQEKLRTLAGLSGEDHVCTDREFMSAYLKDLTEAVKKLGLNDQYLQDQVNCLDDDVLGLADLIDDLRNQVYGNSEVLETIKASLSKEERERIQAGRSRFGFFGGVRYDGKNPGNLKWMPELGISIEVSPSLEIALNGAYGNKKFSPEDRTKISEKDPITGMWGVGIETTDRTSERGYAGLDFVINMDGNYGLVLGGGAKYIDDVRNVRVEEQVRDRNGNILASNTDYRSSSDQRWSPEAHIGLDYGSKRIKACARVGNHGATAGVKYEF